MTDTAVTFSAEEKRAVVEALNHVWREVFDQKDDGTGGLLLSALAKLEPPYKALLPYRPGRRY